MNEIQEVYRLQGVNINDPSTRYRPPADTSLRAGRHIEVITRQMMRWVRVEDVGDTEVLVDEQVDPSTRGALLRRSPLAQGRRASGGIGT